MSKGTSKAGKARGATKGASTAPKASQTNAGGGGGSTVSTSQIFTKGSMQSVSSIIEGGEKTVADAFNSSNGNMHRAARTMQERSRQKVSYAGEHDGYHDFNVYKSLTSTAKPITLTVDTNAERRKKINKQNAKNMNAAIFAGLI